MDTETGGLDPNKHSILSLGGVVLGEDLRIIDEFEVYIKEDEIVAEQRALDINKIDLKWLKENGKNPKNAVSSLYAFLSNHFPLYRHDNLIDIAGHNIGFDVGFVKRLYNLANSDKDKYNDIFSHRTLDTAGIVRFLMLAGKLNLQTASSNAAFKHFGIEVSEKERHTALGDARATAILLRKLVELVNEPTLNNNDILNQPITI